MFGVTIILLLCIGAIGGGVLVWRRTRDLPTFVRLLLALVPLGAATATFLVLWTYFNAPTLDWNGGKLAPIVAMVKAKQFNEDQLYQPPSTGVMTAWIYGPMPAILFLPAAIASRPTNEILIALFINICLYFGPALWVHLRLARTPIAPLDADAPASRGGVWFGLFAFLIFVWITLNHESLCRASMMIAPDGPTLAFAIASLALLMYRRRPIVLIASAACAVFTCWCKQSAIPFLIVAPIYLLIVDGLVAAGSYLLILTIVGAVISTILILLFGTNMWFHMVQLPAAHGWEAEAQFGRPYLLGRAFMLLLGEMVPTLGVIALTLLLRYFLLPRPTVRRSGSRLTRFIAWSRDNPWFIFVIAAVVFVPSALLGFLKVGGYVNNFSLVHVFVALCASALLIRLYAQIKSLGIAQVELPLPAAAQRTLVLAMLALLVMWDWPDVLLKPRRFMQMYQPISDPWNNQQEVIYDFSKRFPGLVYFPWNNLAVLLAEGRQYHFEWGIHDRYEAGMIPSNEQIVRHLPPKVAYVGFGPFHQGQETRLRWFPDWTAPATHEMLKGFSVYTQPPRPTPQRSPASDFDLTPRR